MTTTTVRKDPYCDPEFRYSCEVYTTDFQGLREDSRGVLSLSISAGGTTRSEAVKNYKAAVHALIAELQGTL